MNTPEFAVGEVAYRRGQATGPLSWRERLLLLGGGAFVVLFVANLLWSSIT